MLLSDFHREQAWDRWLSLVANGMRTVKEVALGCLRRIANSVTLEEYNLHVQEMHKTNFWNDDLGKKFRNWVEKTWLPLHKVKSRLISLSLVASTHLFNKGFY